MRIYMDLKLVRLPILPGTGPEILLLLKSLYSEGRISLFFSIPTFLFRKLHVLKVGKLVKIVGELSNKVIRCKFTIKEEG